jgi:hypothetical protein
MWDIRFSKWCYWKFMSSGIRIISNW